MEIKILKEKENPLLNRREIMAEIPHPGRPTPLRKEISESLVKALGAKDEQIIIEKIFTRKGLAACEAMALVYGKKEDIPKEKLAKQERRLARGKKPEGEAKEAGEEPEEKKEPKEGKKE